MELQTIISILVFALFGTAIANLSFTAVNRFVVHKQDPSNNRYYKRTTVIRLFDGVFISYFLILSAFATYFWQFGHLLEIDRSMKITDKLMNDYNSRIAHIEWLTLISIGVAAISIITAIAYFKSRAIFAKKQIPTDIVEKKMIRAKKMGVIQGKVEMAQQMELSKSAMDKLSTSFNYGT